MATVAGALGGKAMTPTTHTGTLEPLPVALRPLAEQKRWCMWRWVQRKDGKWTKPPYQGNGPNHKAKNNTPSTWCHYRTALSTMKDRRRGFDGLGFMLLDGTTAALDLDKCRNPETKQLTPWAQAYVNRALALGAYVEETVSGKGMRILGIGEGGQVQRKWIINKETDEGIEAFRSCARFITVSGVEVGSCSALPNIDSLIDEVVATYDAKPKARTNGAKANSADLSSEQFQELLISGTVNGIPPEHTGAACHSVVWHLAAQGKGLDEIIALLRASPNGVAAKFLKPSDRLDKEVARSFEKYGEANGPFPHVDKAGNPKSTAANTRVAIGILGVACSYDAFRDRMEIGGQLINAFAGELSDNACVYMRKLIDTQFGFDPGREKILDAAVQLCLENRIDPVREYLDALQWDGVARIETWLCKYTGAEDTALNRAFSRISLIAQVRRARQPGVKFDQIVVLEGPEGTGKSSLLTELAVHNYWFSDQTILGLSDRDQQERLRGVWVYEIADLTNVTRAEVEAVKAFASRTEDRARPAFGRVLVALPRRGVIWATTNNREYLRSQTGNRRFWPVLTSKIDLDAFKRDRDQLLAEAAAEEAKGASIVLPPALWGAAAEEQEQRREYDPWEDVLVNVIGTEMGTKELLSNVLYIPTHQQNDYHAKRAAVVMRRLGWEGPKVMRIDDKLQRGFRRSPPKTG
jgi:Virulence-associated protein E